MANFLIQTIDGQVKHDFSFALIEAIDYQNWLNKGTHDYELVDINDIFEHDYTGFVPSGTIQFIKKYLASYYDIHTLKPINIPTDLRSLEYTKRMCWNMQKAHIESFINLHGGQSFVKSNEVLKGFTGIIDLSQVSGLCEGSYLVSDVINIESEWRSFVFNGQLVGLQNYSGDFTMFPDIEFINSCIKAYTDAPPAYTLDIGMNKKDGTFVIEVHNFYSCGLYGFDDSKILPQMFIRGFNHLMKNKF